MQVGDGICTAGLLDLDDRLSVETQKVRIITTFFRKP